MYCLLQNTKYSQENALSKTLYAFAKQGLNLRIEP